MLRAPVESSSETERISRPVSLSPVLPAPVLFNHGRDVTSVLSDAPDCHNCDRTVGKSPG